MPWWARGGGRVCAWGGCAWGLCVALARDLRVRDRTNGLSAASRAGSGGGLWWHQVALLDYSTPTFIS